MLGKVLSFIIKKSITAIVVIVVLIFLLRALITLDAYFLFETKGYLQWMVPVVGAIIIYAIGAVLMYRLRKTERLKSEFITVVAHRLRTPLTRIGWMITGLGQEVQTEEGKNLATDAEKTTKELTTIVNQFLDAMEAGDSGLYDDYLFEEGNIAQVIRQVVTDYASGIQRKGLNVIVDIAEDSPKINMDKERMRIAIGALLENAVLYTPQNGKINITLLQKDDKSVGIEIVDNGIGLSKEEMSNLFSKFYRGKRATSIDRDRAGLGLFLAKQIVKKHGGRIEVGSLGISHGSRFAIILPVVVKV